MHENQHKQMLIQVFTNTWSNSIYPCLCRGERGHINWQNSNQYLYLLNSNELALIIFFRNWYEAGLPILVRANRTRFINPQYDLFNWYLLRQQLHKLLLRNHDFNSLYTRLRLRLDLRRNSTSRRINLFRLIIRKKIVYFPELKFKTWREMIGRIPPRLNHEPFIKVGQQIFHAKSWSKLRDFTIHLYDLNNFSAW